MDENNVTNEFTQPLKEEAPKKKKKKGTFFKVLAVVLLCCIVAGVLAIGGETIYKRYASGGFKAIIDPDAAVEEEPEIEVPKEDQLVIIDQEEDKNAITKSKSDDSDKADDKGENTAVSSGELSAADVYEQNKDAMVSISTSVEGYNAWGQRVQGAAAGSGFIVSEKGFVLTNFHVIEDSSKITCTTYDGESYNATVVGYDESNDIAVLKLDSDNTFQAVEIGDSDKCKVGEEVYAIGNSLGEFDFSMTRGIISGLARNVKVSSNRTMTLIQTDCTINSGNSGGALFNSKGEVIGITNAKYSSSGSSTTASIENVAFAIPINSVAEIVSAIVNGEGISSPYIGVSVANITTDIANATGVESGAYIASVSEGGPAEEGGLNVGDIIVKANDTEIASSDDLVEFIAGCSVGDDVEFTIYRQSKEEKVNVTIGEKTDSNVVYGEDAESYLDDNKPSDNQQQGNNGYGYSFSYGGNGSQGGQGGTYYDGYGSMSDIFSHIFGNLYGY